jgi:acyl-CoA thioesterase FadM
VELGDVLVLDGRTRHAVLDRATGAPRRLPAWLAALPLEP